MEVKYNYKKGYYYQAVCRIRSTSIIMLGFRLGIIISKYKIMNLKISMYWITFIS